MRQAVYERIYCINMIQGINGTAFKNAVEQRNRKIKRIYPCGQKLYVLILKIDNGDCKHNAERNNLNTPPPIYQSELKIN